MVGHKGGGQARRGRTTWLPGQYICCLWPWLRKGDSSPDGLPDLKAPFTGQEKKAVFLQHLLFIPSLSCTHTPCHFCACVCLCVPGCLIFFSPRLSPEASSHPPVCLILLPFPTRRVSSLSSSGIPWVRFLFHPLLHPYSRPPASAQWGLQPALLLLGDEEAVAKRQ